MQQRQSRPVFCIVDPSLKDFVGHHFAYDHAVASAAEAAGFRPVVLAHRDVSAAVAAHAEVRRCFRRDIWDDGAFATRLPTPFRTIAGMLSANHDFHADLIAATRDLAMPPGSIVFAHMIFRNQLAALARFVTDQKRDDAPLVILLLRYQPAFYANAFCAHAFRKLERAAAAGRRVRLASDSARLARALGSLTSLPIEVMPIPHTASSDTIQPPRAPHAPLRCVSLGNARDEKGFLEILDAIRLLRDANDLAGLEFVLQSNDAAADMRRAIDRFAAEKPANVTLLPDALSPEDYDALLRSADVVLLPYWREIYRARTSGVLVESIAAGKIVICTRDTWMSDEVAHQGAGVLVDDHDPAALVAALRLVRRDRVKLAARAVAGRAACLARHNPWALVRQAQDGPGSGTRRVAMFYPWDDFLDRRSGASLRCDMLTRKLAPLVEEIRVLQGGSRAADPTRCTASKAVLAAKSLLLSRLLPRPPEDGVVVHGNVTVERVVLRLRQHLARRLFRLPFRLLLGSRFGQELGLWYFLERRLDPLFRRRARALVAWADVVLLEYPYWAGIVAPYCRALGKTLIVTNHDVLSQQVTASRALNALTRRLEIAGAASADHAVCVSDADRAWFADAGVTATVIPNPVDPDRMTGQPPDDPPLLLREQYDIALPPGPVCLFVGSLFGPNVEAAERIKTIAARMKDAACPVAFVIAGGCAEPMRGDNWIALGRIADGALAALYHLAALVLIPLRDGTGSSVKTVEALAAGKPVLGTGMAFRGIAARPEEDRVREDDLSLWPTRIAALLSDPDRLASIGAAARRTGAAYDYRTVFDAYLPLLALTPREAGAATLLKREI